LIAANPKLSSDGIEHLKAAAGEIADLHEALKMIRDGD
jgi:hypothetical protein